MPWPVDPELARLRRLQRMREVEEEKARIREWLRQHGLPQQPASPHWPPLQVLPMPGRRPYPAPPIPRDVFDVIGRIR